MKVLFRVALISGWMALLLTGATGCDSNPDGPSAPTVAKPADASAPGAEATPAKKSARPATDSL